MYLLPFKISVSHDETVIKNRWKPKDVLILGALSLGCNVIGSGAHVMKHVPSSVAFYFNFLTKNCSSGTIKMYGVCTCLTCTLLGMQVCTYVHDTLYIS